MQTYEMNAKKSSRTRESVFKAHVLEKLYPSENTQKAASTQQLPTKVASNVKPPILADVKVYTVQLPPEGLPEAQTQASSENLEERLESSGSESESIEDTEDDEHPPRKRTRKRKYRRKTSKVGHSSEILPSSFHPSHLDLNPETGPREETQIQTIRSSQTTDASSLTKNQRRKHRKKRAKLQRRCRFQERLPRQATEFTCDVDEQHAAGRREADDEDLCEEHADKVKEFMEAIWRVFSSDRRKTEIVVSQTQPFLIMIEQLANHQMRPETVHCLREIKKLLVLQDFTRARSILNELRGSQSSTSESDNISLFSTLAEYWMTDIAALNCN